MILIVDDQPDTCQPLCRALIRVGYDVQCLAHGRDALQFVAGQTPDLVLLDLMMPDLSGFDILQSLREKESTADVPVFMYTASGSKEIRQRAARLGANDFITKGSLEWPELLAKVSGITPGVRRGGAAGRASQNSAFA